MMYEGEFPPNFDVARDDAGTIHEFLLAHGLEVHGVSVTAMGIVVDAESDPTDLLTSFQPEPSQREVLMAQLEAINLNTATTAKLREAVTIIKHLVNR